MKRSVSVMLLPQMSYAAAMHMALMLFAFKDNPIADHTGMLIWWVFLGLEYGIMNLFLRKSRELRSVVLVSAAVLLCQLLVMIWRNPVYPGFLWWATAVFMWGATYYQCVSAFLMGVKPEAMMTNFEVTCLTLFAAAVMVNGGAVDSGVLLHLGLVCCAFWQGLWGYVPCTPVWIPLRNGLWCGCFPCCCCWASVLLWDCFA